ncbi:thymidylate synthase [Sphingomonas sp.]|uniref:thymidylate synthase n=1 Tax=Sphingomonas sp. TaxID=28214 RepID=UPI0035C7C4FF
MIVIQANDLDDAYRELLQLVLTVGREQPSRLGPTLDAGPVALTIAPGPVKLLTNPGRAVNPALAIVEACWMLSGGSSVEPLAALAPAFLAFSDDGATLAGAYGERLRHRFGFDQLAAVADHLREDPDSRRAFALIAEPEDSRSRSRDVPCNIALMFRIAHERVNMTVVNRSNDVIFGVPYDLFSLSLLHFAVCRTLGREMGEYLHISNSMHMYRANADLAERSAVAPPAPLSPTTVQSHAFLEALVDNAAAIESLDFDRIGDGRLRALIAASLSGRGTRADLTGFGPNDWLGAMARRWAGRSRTSRVAGADFGRDNR